ncbi:MAG TPA: polysaccharide deacetylase family protein [Burkholderiaceae bacterium]|nr:polysaccharide deacetylase family protein [Burkholderiaceae bacterium]
MTPRTENPADPWSAIGTEHALYSRATIAERKPLRWPEGRPLAFALVVSVEHYELQPPATAFSPPNLPGLFGRGPYPDFSNYTRREYGNRVGFFRLAQAIERHGLRATAAIDAMSAQGCEPIVRELRRLGWEVAGHGRSVNRVISSRMSIDEERAYLSECRRDVEAAIGMPMRGWHGPEYGQSANTPALLAELGVSYQLDWPNDEQPYRMTTGCGPIVSVPMAIDLDDVVANWHRRIAMPTWRDGVIAAVDRLIADGASNARSLVLNLHPWLIGQPFRVSYLDEVLREIAARDAVWTTTVAQIAAALPDR